MPRLARLTALTATVLATAVAVPAPGPAAAAGAAPGAAAISATHRIPPPQVEPHNRVTVELLRVRCSNTEDSIGNDELIVKYDISGQQQWFNEHTQQHAYFTVQRKASTPQDSVRNRDWADYNKVLFDERVAAALPFNLVLAMYDEDYPDADDLLGRVSLTRRPNELPLGVSLHHERFPFSNSDYTIYYKITNVQQ